MFKQDEIVAEMSETEVNYFLLVFIIIAGKADIVVYGEASLVQIYCEVSYLTIWYNIYSARTAEVHSLIISFIVHGVFF